MQAHDDKDAIEYLYTTGLETGRNSNQMHFHAVPGEFGDRAIYVDGKGVPIRELNDATRELERQRSPENQVRTDRAGDLASFCALVKRHGTDGEDGKTEVFVGDGAATAVLDMGGWRRHTISLEMTPCEEWRFWGRSFEAEAATAAEEIAPFVDVVTGDVSGDQLLESLSGLEWTSEEKSVIRMTAAGLSISAAKGDAVKNLPARFDVVCPVFSFAPDVGYELAIRVSARMRDGRRCLVFTASGALAQKRRAVKDVFEKLVEGLPELPVYLGVPAVCAQR